MEYRSLELNVTSAKDLNNVNLITKMDVYVVVSISGADDKKSKQKTPVDRDGNTNPNWNFPMKFTVDAAAAHQNRLTLEFKLRCERSLGDKDVGEVQVPIRELLDSAGDGSGGDAPMRFASYQVRKPSGKPKGQLTFSYKFGETVAAPAPEKKSDEAVTAYPMVGPSSAACPPQYMAAAGGPYPPPAQGGYPPPQQQGGYPPQPQQEGYPPPPQQGGYPPQQQGGYPPQQQGGYPAPSQGYPYPPPGPGYGYPPPQQYGGYAPPPPPHQQYGGYPPPQPGYGYPPPQQGYGYPPAGAVQKPPKKNKMGMGLGAGLLGGALGGLLIGDMIGDMGDCDPGFGDMDF